MKSVFYYAKAMDSDDYICRIEYDHEGKSARVFCDNERIKKEIEELIVIRQDFKIPIGADRIDNFRIDRNKLPTDHFDYFIQFASTLWMEFSDFYLVRSEHPKGFTVDLDEL